ncbi:MAG: hypothetical protein ACLTMP_09775 [Eggerthella lenta]
MATVAGSPTIPVEVSPELVGLCSRVIVSTFAYLFYLRASPTPPVRGSRRLRQPVSATVISAVWLGTGGRRRRRRLRRRHGVPRHRARRGPGGAASYDGAGIRPSAVPRARHRAGLLQGAPCHA